MSEAPKKIWLDEIYVAGKSSLIVLRDEQYGCQEYIRADLVDGLVEALQHISNSTMARTSIKQYALAALKALEEGHE